MEEINAEKSIKALYSLAVSPIMKEKRFLSKDDFENNFGKLMLIDGYMRSIRKNFKTNKYHEYYRNDNRADFSGTSKTKGLSGYR